MTRLIHRALAAIIFCSTFLFQQAQDKESYLFFCPDNDYKPFGYFVTLGGNHSLSRSSDELLNFETSETTSYQATLSSAGKLGPSVELGVFFVPRKGLLRLIDIGIAYRNIKGTETISALRLPSSDLSYPAVIEEEGTFEYSRLSLRLNLQTVTLLGSKSYFHQGPGIFADLSVNNVASYSVPHIELGASAPAQEILTSLNYTAGFTWKIAPGKLLDIYGHMPLLSTGGQTENGWEKIYSSSYRNYVFGIRYQWLTATPSRVCPAFFGGSTKSKKVARASQSKIALW